MESETRIATLGSQAALCFIQPSRDFHQGRILPFQLGHGYQPGVSKSGMPAQPSTTPTEKGGLWPYGKPNVPLLIFIDTIAAGPSEMNLFEYAISLHKTPAKILRRPHLRRSSIKNRNKFDIIWFFTTCIID